MWKNKALENEENIMKLFQSQIYNFTKPTNFTPPILGQVFKANILKEATIPFLADPITLVRPLAHRRTQGSGEQWKDYILIP